MLKIPDRAGKRCHTPQSPPDSFFVKKGALTRLLPTKVAARVVLKLEEGLACASVYTQLPLIVRHFLRLLPALCLAAPAALAQSNFKPGYIVPLSGDTLRGEVDDWGTQRNTRSLLFRATPKASSTEYGLASLRGYGLRGGSIYEVRTLADSVVAVPTAAFLQLLEPGPVRLYYLSDAAGRDTYYAAKATGPAVLLEKKVETVVVNSGLANQQKVSRERNLYRAKLAELMGDCPDMGLYIAQLPFGEKSLRQATQRYANCRGGGVIVAPTEQPHRTMQFGLTVGGGLSQLETATEAYSGTGGKAVATGGVSLNFPLSRRSARLSFITGLLYEQGTYMTEGRTRGFSTRLVKREFVTDASFLRVPLGIRYGFKSGALQPFVQLGVTAGYVLNPDIEYRDESETTPGIYSDWRKLEFAKRSFEQGVFGGVGLKTNRAYSRNATIVLQSDFSNGFSSSTYFATNFSRFYVLLTYDLTKQH